MEALDPAIEGAALSFNPADLTVPAGATIVFANVGGKPHTLTADDGSFDTGVVTPGAEGGRFAGTNATLTVSQPGTFPFHCEIHPAAMKGTLTVTGEARAGPSAAFQRAQDGGGGGRDFAFDAAQASVAPGGEVTWTNGGDAPHTATFDDVALDTGTIDPGADGAADRAGRAGKLQLPLHHPPGPDAGRAGRGGSQRRRPHRRRPSGSGPPPVALGGGGPGGGVSGLVLATGVIGGFLGGFGIAAFLLARRKTKPSPAAPPPAPPRPARRLGQPPRTAA